MFRCAKRTWIAIAVCFVVANSLPPNKASAQTEQTALTYLSPSVGLVQGQVLRATVASNQFNTSDPPSFWRVVFRDSEGIISLDSGALEVAQSRTVWVDFRREDVQSRGEPSTRRLQGRIQVFLWRVSPTDAVTVGDYTVGLEIFDARTGITSHMHELADPIEFL
jgi:hypothetical protein